MSRLIDADELKKRIPITHADVFENCRNCSLLCDWEVEDLVDDAPTIDAVPVIRCKDCAKREYCRTTNVWATVPDDDWFCADAERKSDETD